MEEDEDLHNNLKCVQMTSDEKIAADNAKISTLETSISGESARVAQLTEDIDMLEKDIAASKSKLSDATATRGAGKTFGGISRSHHKAINEDTVQFRGTSKYVPQYVSQSDEDIQCLEAAS